MVLDSRGGLLGTVGGGCGEAEVYELAQVMLRRAGGPTGAILSVDLTEDPEEGGGKVCGGRFDVLLHKLTPSEHKELFQEISSRLQGGENFELQTKLGKVRPGFWKTGGPSWVDLTPKLTLAPLGAANFELRADSETCLFVEPIGLTRRLVIVGAGHIARPLCAMAHLTGYQVVVLDDRSEYAQEQFFPSADQVICGSYQDILPPLVKNGLVSVVLVTRGHRHDQECLRLIASEDLEYLGMIGSRRRVDAVFAELLDEGFSKQDLQKVCAPIGIEIGAQTPAEISVSILAQMIQRRREPEEIGRNPHDRRRRTRSL